MCVVVCVCVLKSVVGPPAPLGFRRATKKANQTSLETKNSHTRVRENQRLRVEP